LSEPSRAGSETIPATAAAAIAVARPTLAHLICLPATPAWGGRAPASPPPRVSCHGAQPL